jgi:hypothetical protein
MFHHEPIAWSVRASIWNSKTHREIQLKEKIFESNSKTISKGNEKPKKRPKNIRAFSVS